MQIKWRLGSFAPRALHPRRWLTAIKRKAVQLATLAINLLLLTVVLVVADHLPFVDVPSGAFYHNAVSALFGARITTGTTPTTFSPDDLVTRGQMAVFLHRGLGRVAYDRGVTANLGTEYVDLAVISLFITGGVPGGTGFVKLDGVVQSSTASTTGCPCSLGFYIDAGDSDSDSNFTPLYNASSGVPSSTNGAITWALSVPTGTFQIFRLKAKFFDTAGPIPGNITSGSLTAIYAPFGKFGGNTLSSSEEVSEESIPNQ
jgi:hypothetical protein